MSPAWTYQNTLQVPLGGSGFVNLDEAHTLVIRSAFTQVPSPLAVSLAKSNLSLEKVAQPQPFNSEIYTKAFCAFERRRITSGVPMKV